MPGGLQARLCHTLLAFYATSFMYFSVAFCTKFIIIILSPLYLQRTSIDKYFIDGKYTSKTNELTITVHLEISYKDNFVQVAKVHMLNRFSYFKSLGPADSVSGPVVAYGKKMCHVSCS